MDFYVVLERAGYRVSRRRRCRTKVGKQHKLTKEDAMKWFQAQFEGVILVRFFLLSCGVCALTPPSLPFRTRHTSRAVSVSVSNPYSALATPPLTHTL